MSADEALAAGELVGDLASDLEVDEEAQIAFEGEVEHLGVAGDAEDAPPGDGGL